MIIVYKSIFYLLNLVINLLLYFQYKIYKYKLRDIDIIHASVPKHDLYADNDINNTFITATLIKKKYKVYRVTLDNGLILDCADTHKLCTKWGYLIFVEDLKIGTPLMTRKGISKVVSVKKQTYSSYMFDVTVASQDHLFYSNDILSANSIVSGIFIVWYLLTNKERNVLVLSVTGDKVKELMDKIEVILKGLPYFLKLGVEVDNKMSKKFDNGCKLVAETTTDRSGASFTIHLLYCDEFALIDPEYLREFYRAVFPTLSSSDISKMIITSTARGLNKFYEIYTDALESKNRFNPIRVDWWEIEGRDEKWKAEQIADLGSEEDFNQEFGNQFLAGSSLLLQSDVLRKIKKNQTKFISKEINSLEDIDIVYKEFFKWHPKFDMDNLKNKACKFVFSIDLADGGGQDYSVLNLFQILPMSKAEIDNIKFFTDEKDFFKMVQVGVFWSNKTSLPDLAYILYYFIVGEMIPENIQIVLEMNHEGNYFRNMVCTIDGDENGLDGDSVFTKFKYNMNDERGEAFRIGLNNTEGVKDHGTKVCKDKIKNNQLILVEFVTCEEAMSYAKNKKGKYESQLGHKDLMLTCINVVHFFETNEFLDMIDELLEFVPDEFYQEISKKMRKTIAKRGEEESDYADMLDF